MNNFFARFTPMFALALHAQGTAAGRLMSWEELCAKVYRMADEERQEQAPAAVDMAACRLAVYTAVDEILLSSPRSGENQPLGWYAYSLQSRYLSQNDGGESFYNNLEKILERLTQEDNVHQAGLQLSSSHSYDSSLAATWQNWLGQWNGQLEPKILVLSVYAMCLCCGFKGQLHSEPEKLSELRKTAANMLLKLLPKAQHVVLPEEIKKEDITGAFNFELFAHIVLPACLSLVWYFVCADFVARIL